MVILLSVRHRIDGLEIDEAITVNSCIVRHRIDGLEIHMVRHH